MMQGVEGDIKYVMPQSGKIKTAELKIDALADQSFATVHISQGGSSGQANFRYDLKRPDFLPKSFTMLICPDGHIAWLQVDSSLNCAQT